MEYLLVAVLFICCGSHVRSDSIHHRYKAHDPVPFYASKVGPFQNPSETYKYYDFPFCRPDYLKEKKQTLSEVLNGDHLIDAPYRLDFRVEREFEVVCRKNLTKEEVSQFRSAIKRDFIFQMYYDDLPIWAFLGRVDLPILDDKANMDSHRYLLYKHIDFDIFFNKDSVVKINARTDPIHMVDLTEDKELCIEFSYSSRWEDSNITFEKRMEKDSQSSIPEIYWFSIMNSCSTLLLTGLLMRRCYNRVIIKKDLTGFLQNDKLPTKQKRRGWKSIRDDVFTSPANKSLLAAALGSGSQLLALAIFILILGLVSTFDPYNQGCLLIAFASIYTITFGIAGYTSTWFYCHLKGADWLTNLLLTGCLYFGPLLFTLGLLHTIAFSYKTTSALPFGTFVGLACIWTLIALLLLLSGGIVGEKSKVESQDSFETPKCTRESPPCQWYRHALPQMALAGFLPYCVIFIELNEVLASILGQRFSVPYNILFIDFILLLIITAVITVIFTCYQLFKEDYQWWWRSFLCGGSTGLYVFGYSIYYYHDKSYYSYSDTLKMSFFFGYMACISYGLFLMLGTVGFLVSWLLVRRIYHSL